MTGGWFVLILPPLFWAGNFVVGRAARDDVPPMMLAFARHFVALVFLLPFGWVAMRRDIKRYWERRWQLVRLSLAGLVAFNLLVYLSLHSTTASNAQLMNSIIPVLIVVLGELDRQQLSVTQIAGLSLSCAGVLMIILHGDFARLLALQLSHGDLMVLGGMVSFALFSVWLRSFPADLDRLGLLGAQLTIAVVVLFPLLLWEFHWSRELQVLGHRGAARAAIRPSPFAGPRTASIRAAFARSDLLSTESCGCIDRPDLGDQQMRILMIIVLSATLAGCTGDRVKQTQSPGTAPLLILTA